MKRIQLTSLLAMLFMFVAINVEAQNTKKMLDNEKQRKEVMATIANDPAMRMEMMAAMKMTGEKIHYDHKGCKMHEEKMKMKDGDMKCTKACCAEMGEGMKEEHKEKMKERKEEMKERKEELKDQIEDIKDDMEDLEEDVNEDVKDMKKDMKEDMKDKKKKKNNK